MPSFELGMMKLVSHNKSNNGYLNGQFSGIGWWYYFPEAIALKEPIALLRDCWRPACYCSCPGTGLIGGGLRPS